MKLANSGRWLCLIHRLTRVEMTEGVRRLHADEHANCKKGNGLAIAGHYRESRTNDRGAGMPAWTRRQHARLTSQLSLVSPAKTNFWIRLFSGLSGVTSVT